MKFTGFGDWIEIFKGGKQVDSTGRTHDGDAIIDKAVSTFNAAEHEPPMVVGHPKDNAPAYGWVDGLKTEVKDGVKVLLMKGKQVVPEFEDLVQKGLYKKRSASFYPDGRLRHVGFLGAAPPAVKGLADLSFSDDDEAITFDFEETSPWTWSAIAGMFRKLREYLIEKEGLEKANELIPDWDIEEVKEAQRKAGKSETRTSGFEEKINHQQGGKNMDFKEKVKSIFSALGVDMSKVPDDAIPDAAPEGAPASFTEADVEKLKKEAAEEAEKKKDAEFAETKRKEAKAARDKEISDWIEQRAKDGKLLPAWVDSGITAFAQGLDGDEETRFAEGDADKKTSWQWFKDFLEGFGESSIFREMATKEAAGEGAEFSDKETQAGLRIAARVNPKEQPPAAALGGLRLGR